MSEPAYSNPGEFDMEVLRKALRWRVMTDPHLRQSESPSTLRNIVDWLVDDVIRHEGGRHSPDCVDENAHLPRSQRVCVCGFPPVFRFVIGESAWWHDA